MIRRTHKNTDELSCSSAIRSCVNRLSNSDVLPKSVALPTVDDEDNTYPRKVSIPLASDAAPFRRRTESSNTPSKNQKKKKNSKADFHSVFMFAKHSPRRSRNARNVNKFLENVTFRCLANTVVHEDRRNKQINGRLNSRKAFRRACVRSESFVFSSAVCKLTEQSAQNSHFFYPQIISVRPVSLFPLLVYLTERQ